MAQDTAQFVRWFEDLTLQDVPLVGGKNAYWTSFAASSDAKALTWPTGFEITADAYRLFLQESGLDAEIQAILSDLNKQDVITFKSMGVAFDTRSWRPSWREHYKKKLNPPMFIWAVPDKTSMSRFVRGRSK